MVKITEIDIFGYFQYQYYPLKDTIVATAMNWQPAIVFISINLYKPKQVERFSIRIDITRFSFLNFVSCRICVVLVKSSII